MAAEKAPTPVLERRDWNVLVGILGQAMSRRLVGYEASPTQSGDFRRNVNLVESLT